MRFYGVAILSFTLLIAKAQPTKETDYNTQFWGSINSTLRVADRWGVMADVHVRRDDFLKNPNFYFLRLGAVHWVSDELTLAGGGALLWLANPHTNGFHYALEKRFYQQAQWRESIARLSFLFRIRNEQRWHEVLNEKGAVNRVRFSNRLRFLISTTIPIFKNPKYPRLVIADEMLIHFGKEIVYNSLDQNRVFFGVSQRITKNLSFDMGYMLVYQQKYSGYQYDFNNTFRCFFYYSPDFRKDKSKTHYPIMGDE